MKFKTNTLRKFMILWKCVCGRIWTFSKSGIAEWRGAFHYRFFTTELISLQKISTFYIFHHQIFHHQIFSPNTILPPKIFVHKNSLFFVIFIGLIYYPVLKSPVISIICSGCILETGKCWQVLRSSLLSYWLIFLIHKLSANRRVYESRFGLAMH